MRGRRRTPAPEKFTASIEHDTNGGCWLWAACQNDDGYGRLQVDGKSTCAHRYSWEYHRGAIPPGLHVLHRCDVPACVNPAHLFLGTNADNIADKYNKGRAAGACGERNHHARITDSDVALIRTSGDSAECLAASLGISSKQVQEIRAGRAWRHVAVAPVPAQRPLAGERHPHARLTWEIVNELRALRAEGWKYRELSERFGIPIGTVGPIVTHRFWRQQGGAGANNPRAEAA